jgi:glyoxylase-like metal-dependent hydrolase (beta-lactamase superfamily II)
MKEKTTMEPLMCWCRRAVAVASLTALMGHGPSANAQGAAGTPPGVPENAVTRVSDHTYAIIGFPNIGIVIGTRGALVMDTGLGTKMGAVVVREVEKLSKGPVLYLTNTHYHPEHTAGEQAFPPHTVIVRPKAQQDEMDRSLPASLGRFRQRAEWKAQLEGVSFRRPDIVFDREITLDLGGATARLFWLGAAHTLGDEFVYVEPDGVLFSGDIVQSKLVPSLPSTDSNPANWLRILEQLEQLKPRHVVPNHGALGTGTLIREERAVLAELQTRVAQLKREGKTAAQVSDLLASEYKAKYPDWTNIGTIPNAVQRLYAEP